MTEIVMICKIHGNLMLDQCRSYIRNDRKKSRICRDCKECAKTRNRLYKKNNKEKVKKQMYKNWSGVEIIKCSFCKMEKNFNEFTNSQLKFKYPKCKSCVKIHGKIFQEKYKDRYYEKKKMYINENREEVRKRARKCLLKIKYKITLDHYDELLKIQSYLCGICKNPESTIDKRYNKTRDLSVDHCHKTGKIRALLCDKCNRGLGYFKDSTEILQSAIEYLKAHQ